MTSERPENATPKLGVPTQPGFYWRKLSDGKTEVVKVGYYVGEEGLCCDYKGIFPVTGFRDDTLFYGPIPRPDFNKQENNKSDPGPLSMSEFTGHPKPLANEIVAAQIDRAILWGASKVLERALRMTNVLRLAGDEAGAKVIQDLAQLLGAVARNDRKPTEVTEL